MNKAPEHFRPFNRELAIMGAPFCCQDGSKATIFHWDDFSAIGMVSDADGNTSAQWLSDGRDYHSNVGQYSPNDLVMLPLGMCEGRPVFVGDELESFGGKHRIVVDVAKWGDFEEFRWPRAEPEYPKSRLNITERNKILTSAFPRGAMLSVVGGTHTVLEYDTALLADTAIARAIQDGDVVPAAMLEQVAQAICVSLKVTTTSSIDKAQIAAIIARVKAGE